MFSRFFLFIFVGAVLAMGTGCGKGRFYAVDRPRVDQANMGNAGYTSGNKKEAESISERSTRRIYVFEFDKKKKAAANAGAKKVDVTSTTPAETAATSDAVTTPTKKGITLPYIGDDEPAGEATATQDESTAVAGMQYTVLKDDTLQKISKKVYGSFGKWTKIYDANKDKIKNPNSVKPGIVLTIPQE